MTQICSKQVNCSNRLHSALKESRKARKLNMASAKAVESLRPPCLRIFVLSHFGAAQPSPVESSTSRELVVSDDVWWSLLVKHAM